MDSGISRRHLLAAGGATAASGLAFGRPAAAGTPEKDRTHVETGLDRLAIERWATLDGQRVGVISNPTGVDRQFRHLVDLMHADGVSIGGVFGPEHGFRGSAQAGGSEGTGTDARTGLTVYDAYGASQSTWAALYERAGSARLRTMVDAGAPAADVVGAWRDELAAFEARRRPYLLYRR